MRVARQSLLQRPFDILICVFYGISIPIALLIDSQQVLPHAWFPKAALEMNDWYIQKYKDPLISEGPPWFHGCGYFELLVQLPFFIVAVYAYALGRRWILLPNLAFSAASAAIMIPIVSELILTPKQFERGAVLQMYAPFVVMPLLIMVKTMLDLSGSQKRETVVNGDRLKTF